MAPLALAYGSSSPRMFRKRVTTRGFPFSRAAKAELKREKRTRSRKKEIKNLKVNLKRRSPRISRTGVVVKVKQTIVKELKENKEKPALEKKDLKDIGTVTVTRNGLKKHSRKLERMEMIIPLSLNTKIHMKKCQSNGLKIKKRKRSNTTSKELDKRGFSKKRRHGEMCSLRHRNEGKLTKIKTLPFVAPGYVVPMEIYLPSSEIPETLRPSLRIAPKLYGNEQTSSTPASSNTDEPCLFEVHQEQICTRCEDDITKDSGVDIIRDQSMIYTASESDINFVSKLFNLRSKKYTTKKRGQNVAAELIEAFMQIFEIKFQSFVGHSEVYEQDVASSNLEQLKRSFEHSVAICPLLLSVASNFDRDTLNTIFDYCVQKRKLNGPMLRKFQQSHHLEKWSTSFKTG